MYVGLGNCRVFKADLRAAISMTDRHSQPLGLLGIDLDGLKAVNDGFGHTQGDVLLQAFSQALRCSFRASDRAYRLGGDEFVLLLPDMEPASSERVMARVQDAMHTTRLAGFAEVDASAGLACYPEDGRDPQALLTLSDARMYRAKHRKKVGPRNPVRPAWCATTNQLD